MTPQPLPLSLTALLQLRSTVAVVAQRAAAAQRPELSASCDAVVDGINRWISEVMP